MPVYNGERFIRKAIESILTQTVSNFELIILNDGSSDSSEEIIHSFKDPRIVYIKNESNLKLIKTLNKGLKIARGRYIARMDADDISFPNRFKTQLEIFESYPSVDIVNVNCYLLNEDGTSYKEQVSTMTLGFEAIKYLIPFQNFIWHPAVMVKSDRLKHYRYQDDNLSVHIEDFDLWNRMLADGCLCYTVEDKLFYYRINSNSINHTQKEAQLERMNALCFNILDKRYGFQVNRATLNVLFREQGLVSFKILLDLSKELKMYILLIKSRHLISSTAYAELHLWRRRKLLLVALRSLAINPVTHKFGIAFFLLYNFSWFRNKTLRTVVHKVIFRKNQLIHNN